MTNFIQHIDRIFQDNSNPEKAEKEKAYMRHLFPFWGLGAQKRHECMQATCKIYPIATEKELIQILEILWQKEKREYQHLGCDLSKKYRTLWSADIIQTFQNMITTKSWWDTVDGLAAHSIGYLAEDFPKHKKTMDRWIQSENMWLRRTALIHQLTYKENTDQKKLFDYCKQTMHEKEFFIRKAIGWALRQYAKTNPEAVRKFVTNNKDSLSGLSFREASKYI
jgi:3-methyladenine DNA glycosylase AlkD